jgi:hypothetical protein
MFTFFFDDSLVDDMIPIMHDLNVTLFKLLTYFSLRIRAYFSRRDAILTSCTLYRYG